MFPWRIQHTLTRKTQKTWSFNKTLFFNGGFISRKPVTKRMNYEDRVYNYLHPRSNGMETAPQTAVRGRLTSVSGNYQHDKARKKRSPTT